MNKVTRWCISATKWILWIGLTGLLFCTALWYEAWRIGLIKYACMQTFTPSMNAFGKFVHNPLSGILFNLMLLASYSSLSLMVFVGKHRSNSTERLLNLLRSRNSNTIIFVAGSVIAACACCYEQPYSLVSGVACMFLGMLLVLLSATS